MSSKRRIVIIGASGGFGALFTDLLAEEAQLTGVDSCVKPSQAGTVLHPDADRVRVDEALAGADMVLFCMSVEDLIGNIDRYLASVRQDTLIIDICSTKQALFAQLAEHEVYRRVRHLSIHPMFGPSAGFQGQNVVCVSLPVGEDAAWFRSLLRQWGALVHELGPKEHDLATTATQALCHAAIMSYGLAVAGLGISIETLAAVQTPNSRTLLALAARLSHANPDLYMSIQRAAQESSRDDLAEAASRVAQQVNEDDLVGFAENFSVLTSWYKDQLPAFCDTAVRVHQAQKD